MSGDNTAILISLTILILISNGISYYTGYCDAVKNCIKKLDENM